MMNFLAKNRYQFICSFAYYGHKFYGVQEQMGYPTVMAALRLRIEHAFKQKAYSLVIAARTDKGVHALNNYATFYIKENMKFFSAIEDVQMHRDDGLLGVKIKPTLINDHARANLGKVYRYTIIDGYDVSMSVTHHYAWFIVPSLSLDIMHKASLYLIGRHDFSPFRANGCQAKNTVKEIFNIDIYRVNCCTIIIDIYGQSFLRKMIRNIVGLLVEIGSGIKAHDSIEKIISYQQRSKSRIIAPSHGLMLWQIIRK